MLLHKFLSPTKNGKEWENVTMQFEKERDFLHVIGALDGEHVLVEYPKLSVSLYFNYKGYFSTF